MDQADYRAQLDAWNAAVEDPAATPGAPPEHFPGSMPLVLDDLLHHVQTLPERGIGRQSYADAMGFPVEFVRMMERYTGVELAD